MENEIGFGSEKCRFLSLEVRSVDLSEQDYRGYVRLDQLGHFKMTEYMDIESSLIALQRFFYENEDVLHLQQLIHICGYVGQSKAIEIVGCSKKMMNFFSHQ